MKPMSANEFRAALKRLGFDDNPEGLGKEVANNFGVSAACRFFGVNPSTGRDWASKGPPNTVAVCLRLMLAARIDAAKALKLLEG